MSEKHVPGTLAKLAAAGALGVAALAAANAAASAYRRPEPLPTPYSRAKTRVLIVGGGFGGLAVASTLARELHRTPDVGVALLDRVNYTTFWPMVPQAISGDVEIRHAAHPLRRVLTPLGVEFYQAEARGVDFDSKKVATDLGDFGYDYLVLAAGSQTAFMAKGSKEFSLDLKGLRDALRVRNTILDRFEEAERLGGEYPDGLLTFVFVGAGPTGVEAVCDAHDLIFNVLADDYPRVDLNRVRLVLVNSKDHVLEGLDAGLADAATRRLQAQRVEVINNVHAEEVAPESVTLTGGRKIPARTCVWSAGIQPPQFIKDLKTEHDHRGNIVVDGSLRVKGRSGVFALGDCVSLDYAGAPVPALAQAAEQEGTLAAKNLLAALSGHRPETFEYRSLGQLVDLGEESALTEILGVRFSGLLGSYVWKAVYLRELGYNLNRAQVLSDWILSAFFRPDTSKLFVD